MQYWELRNSDGKHWIIPTKNANTALGIYQPSHWKGKLLKKILPLFGRIKGIYSLFPLVNMPLDDILLKHLRELFPNHRLEFSIFLGTPSVHQKIVIQIFEGHNILGYAKVTDKDCIKQLFDHEELMLQELHEKGVKNVPLCLYNKTIDEERQLFVMTTEKNRHSMTEHSWTQWHEAFLDNLQEKTHKTVSFEDSDFAHSLRELSRRTEYMPKEARDVITRAIKQTSGEYQGKKCDMNVMHGDFTPWNMFKQNDHLYVFDWEYAQRTCPAGLDKWHFIIQSYIFEKHWNAKLISDFIFNKESKSADTGCLRMYLLSIISKYVCREEEGTLSEEIDIYVELLKQIHE